MNHRTRVTLQFVKSHPKRRTKKIIAALFILLIVGWVASVAYQAVTYNNLASKPEKPCPVILVPVNANTTTAAKPVFSIVYVTQDNCPYCAQENPIIQSIAKTHDVTTVNLTTDPGAAAIVSQYKIATTPTIIIKKNNIEIKRFVVVTSSSDILKAMT
jgi:thiol-disulfide isomerase/thioredoxin